MSKGVKTTFSGNGTFGPYTVIGLYDDADYKRAPENHTLISFQFSGSWNGATVTLYLCNIPSESPQRWAPMTNGDFTSDVADVMRLPAGAQFKAVCSGAGSPLPSIRASFRGQLI